VTPDERREKRFGWTSLLVWALVGTAIEGALGWKVPALLDDELAHTLVRLGHAHGVGLSLVAIVHEALARPLFDPTDRRALRAIQLAAVLLPSGFFFSAFGHPEGDPSPVVVLVPLGALALLYGLGRTAHAAWR
jgi:hypothetical protein